MNQALEQIALSRDPLIPECFGCLPPSGKCERANLRTFIDGYGRIHGGELRLSQCLDISERENPEPEILLAGPGNQCLVIERKGIVWPGDWLARHRFEHQFWELLLQRLSLSNLDDAPYVLVVDRGSLPRGLNRVRNIVSKLADALASDHLGQKEQAEIGGNEPVAWRLTRLDPSKIEFGEPESGLRLSINYG